MRIGIDLDEILAEWMNSFIDFHNINYGTNLERKNFYTFDLWKPLDIKRGEERERINKFSKSNFYKNISPVEGSIEGIDNLQNNKLFIITGRKNKNKSATLDWIAAFFLIYVHCWSQKGLPCWHGRQPSMFNTTV